jgi:colanic acid/amylovoran biosynthesis protein
MWIMDVSPRAWFPYEDIKRIELYPDLYNRFDLFDSVFTILTRGKLSLTGRGMEFLEALNQADIVIHAPGGPTIGALYGGKLSRDMPYLYRLFMAVFIKKRPLFIYAPSMGPFSGRLMNSMRKFIMRRAELIAVRDEVSHKYLREQLGIDAVLTLDSAFQNDVNIKDYECIPPFMRLLENISESKTIGMVVTDLKWHPVHSLNDSLIKGIVNCINEVIDELTNKGFQILLIPQLFGDTTAIPTLEAELLHKLQAGRDGKVEICFAEIDAYGQQILFSKLYAVISMRYLPTIFAMKAGVPFICISYEHKARALIEKEGLTHYVIDIGMMTSEKVLYLFNLIESNHYEIVKTLNKKRGVFKRDSFKTTQLILEKVGNLKKRR